MGRLVPALIIPVFVCLLLACNQPSQYHQSFDIESFNRQDTLLCLIPDALEGDLSVDITISHTPDYKYENLYLQFEYQSEMANSMQEVLSIQLVDSFGQWLGNCSRGTCRVTTRLVNTLPPGQGRKLLIRQYSREEILDGVVSLELSFEQAKPASQPNL